MSVWMAVAALVLLPVLAAAFADWAGFEPVGVGTVTLLAVYGPAFVLGLHIFRTAVELGPLRTAGVQWAIMVGPTLLIGLLTGLDLVYDARVGHRENPGLELTSPTAGRCARCEEMLFADNTGHRYMSAEGEYLCPPAMRAPGDRRHHLVATTSPA
jgi:hypothetical protein